MTGRKLKLLGDDRREQQQYIDSGAETLTSAADYFSGRIQELGEKVECMQGHMDVERELRHRDTGRAERRLDDAAGQRPKRRLTRAICCISQRPCGRCQEGSWRVCVWLSWGGTAEAGAPAFWGKGATCSENVGARAAFIYT